MAPSVAETVAPTAEHIKEKLAAITVKDNATPSEAKPEDAPAPVVEAPAVEAPAATPVLLHTGHVEPLKLSGALDHFESFDTTPTIGREYVGVNLAKWLRAPNSDDLIRDLAITSMCIL